MEIVQEQPEEEPVSRFVTRDVKSTKTTIPFVKNNEFDYAYLIGFVGERAEKWAWLVLILAVIIIITAVSNGANMTDGLDGLATGTSAIMGTTLGVLAYLSGNILYADYLNIMYIPYTGELVIYMSAFIGAMVGFLWYNSYPAQVFMGDTGRDHCRFRHSYQEGITDTHSLRDLPDGKPVSIDAGKLFQVYKEAVW